MKNTLIIVHFFQGQNKFYIQIPIVLVFMMPYLTIAHIILDQLLDGRWRNLFWLKIYQNPDCELDERQEEMNLFWDRVRITMKVNELVMNMGRIMYSCLFIYLIYKSLPEEYYLTYAFINSILIFLSIIPSQSMFFTSMTVFYHVCYQFIIRFNTINKKIKHLRDNKHKADRKKTDRRLLSLLQQHNQVCVHLYAFNQFWNIYLAIKSILFPLSIQLGFYVSFFTAGNIPSRFVYFSGAIFELIVLSCDCLSASAVHKKAHSCYFLLNRISLNKRLSLHVKIKLNNYIQRFNGKSLVFTSFNLFNVTYASYFNVSSISSINIFLINYSKLIKIHFSITLFPF